MTRFVQLTSPNLIDPENPGNLAAPWVRREEESRVLHYAGVVVGRYLSKNKQDRHMAEPVRMLYAKTTRNLLDQQRERVRDVLAGGGTVDLLAELAEYETSLRPHDMRQEVGLLVSNARVSLKSAMVDDPSRVFAMRTEDGKRGFGRHAEGVISLLYKLGVMGAGTITRLEMDNYDPSIRRAPGGARDNEVFRVRWADEVPAPALPEAPTAAEQPEPLVLAAASPA